MARVLIAVDGTEIDARVASVAHDLFGDHTEYLAVSVAESAAATAAAMPVPYGVVYPYAPQGPIDAGPSDDERAHRAEDVARRAAEVAGIEDAVAIGDIGDPAEAIVSAAARHAVDVIVVGSHDRGWFSRLVHPSVSSDVVSTSTIPVLVVKE